MAVSSLSLDFSQSVPQVETEAESWYGLHTRPRHEKIVAQRLQERGVTAFLPLVTEVHRWSDRKKTVQVPLFSCYVFAKFAPNRSERLRVLRVDGVFSLVGARGEGTPIPDGQIDAVRSTSLSSWRFRNSRRSWSRGVASHSARCSCCRSPGSVAPCAPWARTRGRSAPLRWPSS